MLWKQPASLPLAVRRKRRRMPGGTLRVIQRGKTGALHSHLQALISMSLGCSLFLLPPALGKAPWRSCPALCPALRTQRGEGAPRRLILSRQRPSNERFTLEGSKCPQERGRRPSGNRAKAAHSLQRREAASGRKTHLCRAVNSSRCRGTTAQKRDS